MPAQIKKEFLPTFYACQISSMVINPVYLI